MNYRTFARRALSLLMVSVGVSHFTRPDVFVAIVPHYLPAALWLVWISGLFEILGGLGLELKATRRPAAWGLIALYLAVFPANLNMAMNDIPIDGEAVAPALLWLRLPLQLLFIAWAYAFTGARRDA